MAPRTGLLEIQADHHADERHPRGDEQHNERVEPAVHLRKPAVHLGPQAIQIGSQALNGPVQLVEPASTCS